MSEPPIACLRVAVFASSAFQRMTLKRILEQYGVIVLEGDVVTFQPAQAKADFWDAILITVDEKDATAPWIHQIAETSPIPVLFNDAIQVSMIDPEWSRQLVNKLLLLVYGEQAVVIKKSASMHKPALLQSSLEAGLITDEVPVIEQHIEQPKSAADTESYLREMPSELRKLLIDEVGVEDDDWRSTVLKQDAADIEDWLGETEAVAGHSLPANPTPKPLILPVKVGPALWTQEAAQYVWVLGASLGGLQAIKQFLLDIPSDLPVALILALHIGKEHIVGLLEQLRLATQFNVLLPTEGHIIRHHQLIVIPPDSRIEINQRGRLELFSTAAARHLYNPCIDDIMEAVALRYRSHGGAIVFSGMGYDGVKGSQKILEQGGVVWCQSRESSVVSGMIDGIMNLGIASFSAEPRRLSKHFVHRFQSKPTPVDPMNTHNEIRD